MILSKKYLSFQSQKWPVCLVRTRRLSNSSPQRHCFQLRGDKLQLQPKSKFSAALLWSVYKFCLSLRCWNLPVRRNEHQDRGPQYFWYQLLVSWKIIFPWTELGEMVWGKFKCITFIVHFISAQFSSVAQSCPTLCDPMNRSMPGLPVHHQLLEFIQTHVHWVGDAIQPSHPLSSPSPPTPNPSQHQGLFQWVNSLHEVAKDY